MDAKETAETARFREKRQNSAYRKYVLLLWRHKALPAVDDQNGIRTRASNLEPQTWPGIKIAGVKLE
jgi:hypothetical protein